MSPIALVAMVAWVSVATIARAEGGDPLAVQATRLSAAAEPMQGGAFAPTWESLAAQRTPDWFRDAKFGIWAHWGPQCSPERGDWYGRLMYVEGSPQNRSHVERFGHPSVYGFKDVIHDWQAQRFDPEKLVAFYKANGAKYFFALANHHDNFDLWDSKHQPWNSVALGPKRDLIDGWEKAARANGLPFGVSVHAAHAWSWYETAQGHDKAGQFAGVDYDGKLTEAQGAGTWWEGLDPQQLYEQNHVPGERLEKTVRIWDWETAAGVTPPDDAYIEKFYDRTIDLINQHHPDLIYFDDTVLPMYPISDVGMKIAAHFYNTNLAQSGGASNGVLFGKVLKEAHKKAITWDVERGAPPEAQAIPWQTDTCLGNWHYDRPLFDRHGYKTAATVIHTLADVVSKNGNLLLNVPVRGDGTIDEDETRIVSEVGAWLKINGEAIYATRPWRIFGEGPAMATSVPIEAQGFNEGKGRPLTAQDIRFTSKGDTIYAITMGVPTGRVKLKSLGTAAGLVAGEIKSVELVGGGALKWTRTADALTVEMPADAKVELSAALKISTGG